MTAAPLHFERGGPLPATVEQGSALDALAQALFGLEPDVQRFTFVPGTADRLPAIVTPGYPLPEPVCVRVQALTRYAVGFSSRIADEVAL